MKQRFDGLKAKQGCLERGQDPIWTVKWAPGPGVLWTLRLTWMCSLVSRTAPAGGGGGGGISVSPTSFCRQGSSQASSLRVSRPRRRLWNGFIQGSSLLLCPRVLLTVYDDKLLPRLVYCLSSPPGFPLSSKKTGTMPVLNTHISLVPRVGLGMWKPLSMC